MIASTAVGVIVMGTAACGGSDSDTNNTGDPTPAACLVDDPDCYETGAEPSGG
jgi:hypothetical protein